MARSTGPTVGQSLFTPIPHLQLRKLGRKHIHLFLREKKNYDLSIADTQATGSTIHPIYIRASIYRDFLLSLVEFGEFTGVSNPSDVTKYDLQEWLNANENFSFKSFSIQEIKTAIKSHVHVNSNAPDLERRIKSLFVDFKTFLRTKKWDHLVESNPKLVISENFTLLKPPPLKNKIESGLEIVKMICGRNGCHFTGTVLPRL